MSELEFSLKPDKVHLGEITRVALCVQHTLGGALTNLRVRVQGSPQLSILGIPQIYFPMVPSGEEVSQEIIFQAKQKGVSELQLTFINGRFMGRVKQFPDMTLTVSAVEPTSTSPLFRINYQAIPLIQNAWESLRFTLQNTFPQELNNVEIEFQADHLVFRENKIFVSDPLTPLQTYAVQVQVMPKIHGDIELRMVVKANRGGVSQSQVFRIPLVVQTDPRPTIILPSGGYNPPELTQQKIKILFIAANPEKTPKLALDEEIRAIYEKIQMAKYRDSLELTSVWAVRPGDLLQYLNEFKPHIVHFSGHGNSDGEIYLLDQNRNSKLVSTQAIQALFATLKDNVQLVVLNACYSKELAQVIVDEVGCVFGMNAAIFDDAAIIFSAAVYRAIGFGRSLQEAFDQGKAALMLEGNPNANVPELLTKKDIDPSKIYLLKT